MPQLEDTPKLVSKAAPTGSDLISIFDVDEAGYSRIKRTTLLQALTAVLADLPGPYSSNAAAASGLVPVGGLYLNDVAVDLIIAVRY